MNESLFSIRNALRMLALILLATMFVVTIKNTVVISKGNEKIQAKQLETLTKVLISQASLSASKMITQQDQERLLELTNQLSQDRLVFDTTIYDAEGIRLASSEKALSVREVLGLDTPLSTASIGRQQLVEPIYSPEKTIIGFIRVTFETGKMTAISDHHYRKSDRYMIGMVLMGFVSGVLFIMLIRRRQTKSGENLLLKNVSS
ncbi:MULTISPECIES: YtjB family periplasmic protein [Vibrio]|jgi:membrane protein|uniref:YtjB family periplasmic protein n=3 Tax=Vibrio cyclitrophicus TaxID=47951 RepID=A0ACD5FRW5_9VIBR|nr:MULTISPECIES: YtjB family periplasmic protein [Vibrio]MBY7660951.1 YtjB family periplasmic protein [Vibrio atlanticus]MBE8556088.1 YtjB family periplasmic protein [Vibrio sp. OPT24]MBE8605313.1 YtjB family periplasmic protein [Vibrio sp. OPT10]MBU2930753.1 YtjB family periplasmic protein [Vibrio cyclitrophicus]MCC4773463.1 YtjB family periplasmic protein [Vibrio cyclitrophicus]